MESARLALLREIEAGAFSGLRPRKWLCVGAGFSREEVKGHLLKRGGGLTGQAVTSPETLALAVLSEGAGKLREPALSPTRQEGLRLLLANRRVNAFLPELKKLKRQGQFYRRLDQAVQAYRLAAAHEEEARVFELRLAERSIRSGLRPEVAALATAFEAWLEGEGLIDPPGVYRGAQARLAAGGGLAWPEEIVWLGARRPEGCEAAFWDELARHARVKSLGPGELGRPAAGPAPGWERWHTVDDAAEALAETLLTEYRAGTLSESAVLIPDQAGVRRSLRRALAARGVPLADPRDPNRLKWDEAIKRALLPLETVARDFERGRVVSYLSSECGGEPALASAWAREINARGLRRGLAGYAGGKLALAHEKLEALERGLGGRQTALGLAEAHLAWLRERTPESTAWVVPFFETLWRDFVRDVARVGQAARPAPALFWWERFQARVAEAPAPVERLKPESGVEVYRFHQCALRPYARVYVLGVAPADLDEAVGDYAYTEREREALGADFAVRSRRQAGRERLAALADWVGSAAEVTWLDAHYAPDGRELESAEAVLRQVSPAAVPEPREGGAHLRWRPSFGAARPLPPQVVCLPRPAGPLVLTATALEAYSRCPFIALSDQKWRLFDGRDPDADLWPDARGNILHRAVRLLLESRTPEGAFALSHPDALEAAWAAERPKGLMRSPRVIAYVQARLLETLETFVRKERAYFDKVRPETVALDNVSFELSFGGGLTIKGTPDRVDRLADGLWIIDYKTSSAPPPHGSEMIELGYRLQLPFYALAVAGATNQPVIGLQFVSLTAAGGRSSGVFFKAYNGKDPGKPTELRANSKSLLAMEPGEAWARAREHLEAQAQAYARGEFSPVPRRGEKECATCRVADLCGYRRLA